ncbi:MAG: hypothetical protein AB8G11_13930 [Saprospiraceae bacterium]
MKNLFLIAVFAMISTLAYSQKDVRVEKEIENGQETTRVWIDGKEVKEGSAEYKKYAKDEITTDGNVKIKKRKGKKDDEEKVIIIKKEMKNDVMIISDDEEMDINVDVKEDGDNHKVIIKKKGKDGKEEIKEIILKTDDDVRVIELDGENDGKKKKMFIQIEEDVNVTSGDDVEVDVDVKTTTEGKKKVIIKKKTKDGKEEIEEIIIDDNGEETIIDGDTKVIIKTKKGMDLDLDGIDPEDIETVNVIKEDGVKKVTIKTKDGKTIVKELEGDNVKVIKKRIKTEKTEAFDFDLDGLNPEDIETIDVDKTKDGKTVTIKMKDGKTIVKKVNEDKK